MAARFLLSLIDPTTHNRGGGFPPNDQAWKAHANTAKVVLVDNAGHITPAMSAAAREHHMTRPRPGCPAPPPRKANDHAHHPARPVVGRRVL